MTYNSTGKRITSENLAGQVTTTAWDCCHKVSETQPDGSTTTWDYDDEGRMVASSRLIPLSATGSDMIATVDYHSSGGTRGTGTWTLVKRYGRRVAKAVITKIRAHDVART